MKITDVEIVQALHWPFVRIHTDEGISGIGEASLQQKELAVRAEVEAYRDFLIGQDATRIEHIWNALHRKTVWSGGPVTMTAISGIEQALWDIKGKAAGLPVYELLGGKVRDSVKAYANGWFGGEGSLADKAAAAVAQGYDTIKWYPFGHVAQLVTHEEEENAVANMQAIREAVGPKVNIAVDVRNRLNTWSAVRMAQKLQPYDVYWFEEPLLWDNISTLIEVARAVDVPIALGERLYTRWEFREVLESNAVRFIQPDICHAGGIFELRKIAAMAEVYYVMVAPHNSNGPISTVASVHLDACTPNAPMQEVILRYLPLFNELLTEPLVVEDGHFRLPEGPGWGTDIVEDAEQRHPPEMLPAVQGNPRYYYE
ncbi:MAG: galactonate dehydratase [Candidatus Latescibacteria bacterium]|nr:galactonate dehydratase [Candidatus Latescibacterota bacterium]